MLPTLPRLPGPPRRDRTGPGRRRADGPPGPVGATTAGDTRPRPWSTGRPGPGRSSRKSSDGTKSGAGAQPSKAKPAPAVPAKAAKPADAAPKASEHDKKLATP